MSFFNRKAKKTPTRPRQEIQTEYQQCCTAIGDRAFQVAIYQKQIDELHRRMHKLGEEMNVAIAKEKAESDAKARTAAKEQSNAQTTKA